MWLQSKVAGFFILKTAPHKYPSYDLWGITMTGILILECESPSGRETPWAGLGMGMSGLAL